MSFIDTMHDSLSQKAAEPLVIEIHGTLPEAFTGAALQRLVASARGFLTSRGVAAGDRVALVAHNSARWAAADLAILGAGAIVVPLYDRQAPSELRGMIDNSEARLVLAETEALKQALVDAGTQAEIALFAEVFAHAPGEVAPLPREASDHVTMIFTSGTSGEPKGVLYTVANVDFMLARTIERLRGMVRGRPGPDRVFHYLPLCFAGSRIQLWTQLVRGNPIMLSTDLNNLVEEMGSAAPHYFLNVPTLLERIRSGVSGKLRERGGVAYALYRAAVDGAMRAARGKASAIDRLSIEVGKKLVFPKIRQQIGKNLEFLISGSAPLSEDTQRWFELIGIPVYQVYGLTETTAIVTMDRLGRARPGFVGEVIDGVEVRISDEGELICRGPNIFPGYWKRPDATEKALREGWFHTGDMAELGPEGHVRIVGRLKDLLVPESGHNVAPGPLEEKLLTYCEGAQQAMVVGHGKPYLSVIVTGEVSESGVKSAIDRLNEELPHYRRLRRFYIASEPFTVESGLLTANQKLKRAAVEQQYAEQIQRMYA